VTLLPWIWSYLTKESNQGSALHEEERVVMTVARVIEECPQTRLEGEMKSHIGDAST